MTTALAEKRKIYIRTFGCQMNDYDSERMYRLMERRGWTRTGAAEEADLIIVNTCSVRDKPEHKAVSEIGMMRRLRAKNPELVLGLAGCVSQQHGDTLLKKVPGLDLVIGTHAVDKLPDLVEESRRRRVSETSWDYESLFEFENIAPVGDEAPMSWKDVRASGFVPVTRGCDMGCTFCIVPQTRGKEVSRPMDDIVAEVRALVDAGIRDVTLLGQIVNRYGRNLDGKVVFHELIDRLADVPGLYRLRFTSSHPVYLTKALVDCFAKHGVLAPHVHLPVQTASNRLLKEMRRGYTIELYEEKVSALREARDDMAVSTDIIVGYPGETEEDFRDTLEMVERIRFDGLFAFNYSPRPGTPAIGAGDPVPEEEKANRLDAVLQASQRITEEKNRAMVGQVRDVLIEGDGKGAGARFGRTACHRIVHVHAPDAGPGDVLRVKIERGRPNSLSGRVVTNQV